MIAVLEALPDNSDICATLTLASADPLFLF